MRRRTVLAQAATCCVLGLTAGACGSDNPKPAPQATASVSVSGSVSPSSSPSVVAPTMPAEAKGTGTAAAKAVVRLFIDLLDYSGSQGDTRAFRRLFTAGCEACTGVADFIDGTYAAGGEIRGNGWQAIRIDAKTPQHEQMRVEALVEVAPQDVIARSGAQAKHFDGAARVMKHFTLVQTQGNWKIADIEANR